MPVTAAQLALVLGAQAVALATPGPALVSISQKAIAQGRAPALLFGLGLGFGATSWVLASMLGLGLVLHRFPALLMAMTLLGGGYLIYVAWAIWRGADAPLSEGTAAADGFWAGYRLNVSNPKPILFFSSLFLSVFPDPFTLASGAAVYLSMLALELSFFTAVALTLTTPSVRARALRAKPVIDRVAAVVIGALGGGLLWGLVG
jgi:threonine/homoserine/homoserine lactone efflux protein